MRGRGNRHLLSVLRSTWALVGISQALAAQDKDFGLKATLIEPAGDATERDGRPTSTASRQPMPRPSPPMAPVRGHGGNRRWRPATSALLSGQFGIAAHQPG